MADPTIQTFCCHHKTNSDMAVRLMAEFNTSSYLIVCMVSSFLGMVGAVYQIFIRNESVSSSTTESQSPPPSTTSAGHSSRSDGVVRNIKNLSRTIIVWLAVADFCASCGVFMRSAMWRYFKTMMSYEDDTSSVIFCAVSSGWVQYFYTCTWLWTLSYAWNVKKFLKGSQPSESYYHIVVWTVAAALTAIGLSVLYYPNANCHNIRELWTALIRILPNYCVTYLPIAVVMIANPIIYIQASKEINKQLTSRYCQITSQERLIMNTFKIKFSLINIVFYICWLPNLIGGIILWTRWDNVPVKPIIVIWYAMAITNPLQALLNAFVYRKWKTFSKSNYLSRQRESALLADEQKETSPLLIKTMSWISTSRDSLHQQPADPVQSVNSSLCV